MSDDTDESPPEEDDGPLADLAAAVHTAERTLVASSADEWVRGIAKLIDNALLLIITAPVVIPAWRRHEEVVVIVLVLVYLILSAGNLRSAGSVGKWIMGCRILTQSGEAPSFRRLLMRWLVQYGLLGVFIVGPPILTVSAGFPVWAGASALFAVVLYATTQLVLVFVAGVSLHDLATGTCVGYRDHERLGRRRIKAFEVLAPLSVIPFAPSVASSSPLEARTDTGAALAGSEGSPVPPVA